MNRDERIEEYYHESAWDLAERVVDLEDEVKALVSVDTDRIKALENQELDPSRLESALRMYIAELDYDIHKDLSGFNEEGIDMYPVEVDFFLRCWETAGEG
jgi:hypothetical protein